MHFLWICRKKNIGKLFIFENLETLTKKEKVCFLKRNCIFWLQNLTKRMETTIIQIEIIIYKLWKYCKDILFFLTYFLFYRNPHPVEPRSKWKKATTKIKTLNALTTQYSDEHMREDIGDAVVISEDQAQCSKNFL